MIEQANSEVDGEYKYKTVAGAELLACFAMNGCSIETCYGCRSVCGRERERWLRRSHGCSSCSNGVS